MPYVLISTQIRMEVGPTMVGDEHSDPNLMLYLGATKRNMLGNHFAVVLQFEVEKECEIHRPLGRVSIGGDGVARYWREAGQAVHHRKHYKPIKAQTILLSGEKKQCVKLHDSNLECDRKSPKAICDQLRYLHFQYSWEYYVQDPPRMVLDKLEKRGYRVISMTGVGQTLVWCLHKESTENSDILPGQDVTINRPV